MPENFWKQMLRRAGAVRLRTARYHTNSPHGLIACGCCRPAHDDEPQMTWQVVLVQEAVRRDAVFFSRKAHEVVTG